MSKISIKIGPKSYPFVCGDGEEDHIRKLAAIIDEKYQQLGSARAPQEAQNMLFAALFLADELAEARSEIEAVNEAITQDDSQSDDSLAQLREELESLTDSEAQARAEADTLRAELTALRQTAGNQHDLFGGPTPDDDDDDDDLVDRLEALAKRAEATAAALEGAVSTP